MANEIALTASLTYTNPLYNIVPQSLGLPLSNFNITGKNFVGETMSVPITSGGTAIPLGSLGSLGWGLFRNLDPVNYVQLMTATSGTIILRIPPGGVTLIYFDASITAPAAIAHTAAVLLQYLILEV